MIKKYEYKPSTIKDYTLNLKKPPKPPPLRK
jgi:hypothetical protein